MLWCDSEVGFVLVLYKQLIGTEEHDHVLDRFSFSIQQDSGDEEKHEKLLKEITSLSSHGKKRSVV